MEYKLSLEVINYKYVQTLCNCCLATDDFMQDNIKLRTQVMTSLDDIT